MTRLQQAVVDAALEWKRTFGAQGNQAAFIRLSQATDNLISATPTIQECIDRGWVECWRCGARRNVNSKADVTACEQCNDSGYWNLCITAL